MERGSRLQKFIAECGVASRRKAEKLILEGKVRVNGRVVDKLGVKIDPARDCVQVKKKVIKPAPKGIILFHKPISVVSTMSDPEGRKCIADYLTNRYRNYFLVGRLDYHTSGLMIITNDGELAEMLMHPRNGFARVYEAKVRGSLPDKELDKVRRGVKLHDGIAKGRAEILKQEGNNTWVRVIVYEGRNRLVRRMMDKIGAPVLKLRRVAFGPFKLGKMPSGSMIKLSEEEYLRYRRNVMCG